MSDLALMELHAAALFRHDAAGRIVTTNEPDGERAPRLFLGRTRAGNLWRFRDDLPSSLLREFKAILIEEPIAVDLRQPPACFAALHDILHRHDPVIHAWQGPAWHFPDAIASPAGVVAVSPAMRGLVETHYPWLIAEYEHVRPCFAVVRDGAAVSICFSSRRTEAAAEAGVDTVAAFRGRGYATAVAAAWALAVRRSGRLPLYSTSWDNLASQGVARRLGLVLYGVDCSVT